MLGKKLTTLLFVTFFSIIECQTQNEKREEGVKNEDETLLTVPLRLAGGERAQWKVSSRNWRRRVPLKVKINKNKRQLKTVFVYSVEGFARVMHSFLFIIRIMKGQVKGQCNAMRRNGGGETRERGTENKQKVHFTFIVLIRPDYKSFSCPPSALNLFPVLIFRFLMVKFSIFC